VTVFSKTVGIIKEHNFSHRYLSKMNEHSNQKDKLTLDENEMIDLMQHLKKTSASIQDTVNLLKRKHELIYCSGKCDKKETTLKIPQGDHDHDIFRKDLTPLDKDLYHIKFVIEDKDIFPFEKKNQSSQSSSYYLPSKKYVYKEDRKTINYVMYIVKKAHGVIDFENPIDMVQNEHQENYFEIDYFPEFENEDEFTSSFLHWYKNVLDVLSSKRWKLLHDESGETLIRVCSSDKQKYLNKYLYRKIVSVLSDNIRNMMEEDKSLIDDGINYLKELLRVYKRMKEQTIDTV